MPKKKPAVSMPPVDRREVALSDMKPAPYNPRRISDEAMRGLEASMGRFGVVQEPVINERTGHIVGGHQRIEALRKAGVEKVHCLVVDLPLSEEKALNVALNSPHISGEFDDSLPELLASIMGEIEAPAFEELRLTELVGSFAVGEVEPPTLNASEDYPDRANTFSVVVDDDDLATIERAIRKAGAPAMDKVARGAALAKVAREFNG
jgi:hypothetical protein